MATRIKVLLADDHIVVREGLRYLLEGTGEIEVIGEASNGLQVVDKSRQLLPDVIVMDLTMPKLNGLEATRRILQEEYETHPKILILSAHCNDIFIEQLVSMGVHGYLIKQTSVDIIFKAIKDVYQGKNFYAPAIGKRIKQFGHSNEKNFVRPHPHTQMTTREREVLQLIAEGESNKEIASDLYISIKTVEKHRQSIMKKLDIHDVSGLTRYAISTGIIDTFSPSQTTM